jgi:hypothetical protein
MGVSDLLAEAAEAGTPTGLIAIGRGGRSGWTDLDARRHSRHRRAHRHVPSAGEQARSMWSMRPP